MGNIQLVGALAGIVLGSLGTILITLAIGTGYAGLWALGLVIGVCTGYWLRQIEDGTKLIDKAITMPKEHESIVVQEEKPEGRKLRRRRH